MSPVKLVSFEVLQFFDNGKPIILLYGLGENGVVYEMAGGKWAEFPVDEDNLRELNLDPQPPPQPVQTTRGRGNGRR